MVSATPGNGLGGTLKLFADPTRLRMLALLEREELAVGELSRALELSQSRVSNHLRLLREAGMLRERHAGTSTYLRLLRPDHGASVGGRLWDVLRREVDALPEHQADRIRLEGVLHERRNQEDALFDRMATQWDKLAGAFETGLARERAGLHLFPREFVVADLGCGTGYMGQALLGHCTKLISVDRSQKMLGEAERRLSRAARGTELEFRRGDLDGLPLCDAEVHGCLLGMVLHHLPELDAGLAEIRRVIKPGGALSLLELSPHRERWMRVQLGDRHLGLEPGDVLAALTRAGFTDLVLDPVADRYRPRRADAAPGDEHPALSLYIVRGRVPAGSSDKEDR